MNYDLSTGNLYLYMKRRNWSLFWNTLLDINTTYFPFWFIRYVLNAAIIQILISDWCCNLKMQNIAAVIAFVTIGTLKPTSELRTSFSNATRLFKYHCSDCEMKVSLASNINIQYDRSCKMYLFKYKHVLNSLTTEEKPKVLLKKRNIWRIEVDKILKMLER